METTARIQRQAADRVPTGEATLLGLWRFLRRKPLGAAGAVLILALVVIAVFAPLIETYDPNAGIPDDRLVGPSLDHLMGTDDFGRDTFSRVVHASRVSLEVGIVAVTIALVVGVAAGLISGYAGGLVDLLTQRVVDTLLAFPMLIFALVIVGAFGKKDITYVFLALGIVASPAMARVVRGSVLASKASAYIEAARTIGAHPWRIVLRHILPNVTAPIIIVATVGLGQVILAEASLSFLGMGVQPPDPSWGNMIQGSAMGYMMTGAWWMAAFPSLAITLAVLGFNLLGDALRDILDPRLRHV